jgi:hypothetical protein
MATKQIDAKVMYACLKLPEDPEVGEATQPLIKDRTGLGEWQVRRSLKRLVGSGWVRINKKTPGETARDRYWVDDKEQVTKPGTAWLVEKLINKAHAGSDIYAKKFVTNLRPPDRFSHLNRKGVVQQRLTLLRRRKYVEDGDEGGVIRVCNKTIEQRLYIELLAAEVRLPKLASYEFKHTPLRGLKR